MGAYSNPEPHGDNSKLLAQFSATKSFQPGPAVGDQQPGEALEQLPSLVKAWIQDAATEKADVLQAIFQAVAEPLFLLDRERKIVACNEAAAHHVGRGAPELVGVPMSECLATLVPATVCEQWMAQIAEVFRCAARVCFTDEPAGRVRENTICPILDGGGRVAGVVVSIRNIIEHRQTQKGPHGPDENTRRAERLTSLGMISAALTHELAHPLSVARLATQNAMAELERLTCPEVVKQDLRAGLAACVRIGDIVGRFRDLARPSEKAKDTDVRLPEVAQRTFRLLEHSAGHAKVILGTENLDSLPALRMPENEIDDLFFALVQNAVQAADGAKERRLLILGAVQGDAVVLQFQDNCGGIEPAHLPRIFEPFFTTKPPHKGTGLGLCIARRILCQRGGRISVESRYGEGTTFTVTLPRESSPGTGGHYVP